MQLLNLNKYANFSTKLTEIYVCYNWKLFYIKLYFNIITENSTITENSIATIKIV